MDDGASAQIEEIFAQSQIPGASSLPLTHMSQAMLDSYSFAQLGTSLRGLLALAQLDEHGFVRMDADAAALGTTAALLFQGALGAGLFGEVDHPASDNRHLLLSRALDDLPFPIQSKGLFGKVCALANWPRFAIHFQISTALAHPMAT